MKGIALSVINLVLMILSLGVALIGISNKEPILNYLPNFVFLISAAISGIMAYVLLVRKEKKNLPGMALLTFFCILWELGVFLGYFWSASRWFFVGALIEIAVFSFLMIRWLPKSAVILMLVNILVLVIIITSGFEEDYCWEKGDSADPSGKKMVEVNEKEAEILKAYLTNLKAGDKVGVNFKEHIMCHVNFDLMGAMKERYLIR